MAHVKSVIGSLSAASLVTVGLAASSLSAASAAPGLDRACKDGEGITVVVQDPTRNIIRCGLGDADNGAEALENAGFEIDYREEGFICRIGYEGQWFPAGALDDDSQCVEFPPEGGYIYWAYFHTTSPNAPWAYSQWGVLNRDPALNSVEGWRWGTGKEQPNNGTVPPYHVEPSPEPTTPEPSPEPTTPEPTSPEPTTPEPTSPEPTTPEPSETDPTGPIVDTGVTTGSNGELAIATLAGLLALAGGTVAATRLRRR